jgi:hypothetical protein
MNPPTRTSEPFGAPSVHLEYIPVLCVHYRTSASDAVLKREVEEHEVHPMMNVTGANGPPSPPTGVVELQDCITCCYQMQHI